MMNDFYKISEILYRIEYEDISKIQINELIEFLNSKYECDIDLYNSNEDIELYIDYVIEEINKLLKNPNL